MPTTILLDDSTTSKLDKLQTLIARETGRGVTRQEILAQVVSLVYASSDDFVATFDTQTVPLSEDQIKQMQDGRIHSGRDTSESDIDDDLYG